MDKIVVVQYKETVLGAVSLREFIEDILEEFFVSAGVPIVHYNAMHYALKNNPCKTYGDWQLTKEDKTEDNAFLLTQDITQTFEECENLH